MTFRVGQGPVRFYAYLSADAAPTLIPPVGPGVGLMPRVRVEASWELDQPGQGRLLLAHGITPPFDLGASPGQPKVYEAPIDLAIVPGEGAGAAACCDFGNGSSGSRLLVRLVQVESGDTELAQNGWRIHMGHAYPWRLLVPVLEPLHSVRVASQLIGDEAYVLWTVQSDLSSFDLGPEAFWLRVLDADGETLLQPEPYRVRYSNDHDHVTKPVTVTWRVARSVLEDHPDGRFELGVTNQQGTFQVVQDAPFPTPRRYEAAQSPGMDAGVLLGILAVAVLALSPRRRGRVP